MSGLFIAKFEQTKVINSAFKAMIVVPDRKSADWHKKMIKDNKWRLLWYFPKGSKLFSKPGAKEPFATAKRC
jgi:hypothetical protein